VQPRDQQRELRDTRIMVCGMSCACEDQQADGARAGGLAGMAPYRREALRAACDQQRPSRNDASEAV